MAKKRRDAQTHQPGEVEPCAECLEEIRYLKRAQELQEQEGLAGRELAHGAWESIAREDELEAAYKRKGKRPGS